MRLPIKLPKFVSPEKLFESGVLGMNRRNHSYIMRYNDRKNYPDVDDKLRTKKLAMKYGVATAELVGSIDCQFQVKSFTKMIKDVPDFVIKPGHGSGGRGILVVKSHDGKNFYKPNGAVCGYNFIYDHISNILSGLYSLGGKPDYALFERCIDFSDVYSRFSYQGVPDVRLIVFKGYPVMSMIRLATKLSDGRANLHQGAVGVGISIRDGRPLFAAQHNCEVTHHPDTGAAFSELTIPHWEQHLELAAKCAEMTPLGYFGADISTDSKRGPLLLELNARPGLAIQIANGCGLLKRLRLVESLPENLHKTPEEKIAFSRENFD